jgi:hypothetical protein
MESGGGFGILAGISKERCRRNQSTNCTDLTNVFGHAQPSDFMQGVCIHAESIGCSYNSLIPERRTEAIQHHVSTKPT